MCERGLKLLGRLANLNTMYFSELQFTTGSWKCFLKSYFRIESAELISADSMRK